MPFIDDFSKEAQRADNFTVEAPTLGAALEEYAAKTGVIVRRAPIEGRDPERVYFQYVEPEPYLGMAFAILIERGEFGHETLGFDLDRRLDPDDVMIFAVMAS